MSGKNKGLFWNNLDCEYVDNDNIDGCTLSMSLCLSQLCG